jgi:hypothetical protein
MTCGPSLYVYNEANRVLGFPLSFFPIPPLPIQAAAASLASRNAHPLRLRGPRRRAVRLAQLAVPPPDLLWSGSPTPLRPRSPLP